MFHTNYDTSSEKFQNYYKDVSLRMKNKELDILIVVNMFLTGFDATTMNTLWVDKNLKMHGLIQAFSRTNRILNSIKTFGNIVCFRNLQKRVDSAISLFGDKNVERRMGVLHIPPHPAQLAQPRHLRGRLRLPSAAPHKRQEEAHSQRGRQQTKGHSFLLFHGPETSIIRIHIHCFDKLRKIRPQSASTPRAGGGRCSYRCGSGTAGTGSPRSPCWRRRCKGCPPR